MTDSPFDFTEDAVRINIAYVEGKGLSVIPFHGFRMKKNGDLFNDAGDVLKIDEESGMKFVAAVCGISYNYIRGVPPELQEKLLNYHFMERNIRDRCNAITRRGELVGLSRTHEATLPNEELLNLLCQVLSDLEIKATFREWIVSIERSFYYITFLNCRWNDEERGIYVGAVLQSEVVGGHVTVYPTIWDQSEGVAVVMPDEYSLSSDNYKVSLTGAMQAHILDEAEAYVEAYKKAEGVFFDDPLSAISNLEAHFSFSKTLRRSLEDSYVTKGDISNLMDIAHRVATFKNSNSPHSIILRHRRLGGAVIIDGGDHYT